MQLYCKEMCDQIISVIQLDLGVDRVALVGHGKQILEPQIEALNF